MKNNTEEIFNLAFTLLTFLLCIALWFTNIYRLCNCDFKPSYKAEVLYSLGILTPIGLITAWMDIED